MKKIVPIGVLIVLTICSYLYFGGMFSKLEVGIGTQTASAAFSAIFILLATHVLLQQQQQIEAEREVERRNFEAQSLRQQQEFEKNLRDESKQSEKDRKVFEARIATYEKVIDKLNNIFHDNKIDYQEFKNLLSLSYNLTLAADGDSLKYYYLLVGGISERFQTQLSKEGEFNNIEYITVEVDLEMVNLKTRFVNACRRGLDLPGAENSELVQDVFMSMIDKAASFEQKMYQARQEIPDGVSGWLDRSPYKSKRSEGDAQRVEEFLDKLQSIRSNVDIKITNSQVSICSKKAIEERKKKYLGLAISRIGFQQGVEVMRCGWSQPCTGQKFYDYCQLIDSSNLNWSSKEKGFFFVPVSCSEEEFTSFCEIVDYCIEQVDLG